MKLKHKMLIACLTLIAIASTIITFALLTFETDTLVNTFTVGQVSLKLDETDVDETGTPIPNANRVTGNEYKLIPGKEYVKDPTMTVLAGSEASYVRILVTITKAKEIKEVFGENFSGGVSISGIEVSGIGVPVRRDEEYNRCRSDASLRD